MPRQGSLRVVNTVAKLLIDAHGMCRPARVQNVTASKVQCDEIWTFTAAKQKNVAKMKTPIEGVATHGRCSCLRDSEYAIEFMDDGSRLANRVQLTTDGLKAYLEASSAAMWTMPN